MQRNTTVAKAKLKSKADKAAAEKRLKSKTGGRIKGTPNKATIAKEEALDEAMRFVFADLTEEQINNITPLQIMEMCGKAAVRAGRFALSMAVAKDWAPYVHAKLATRIIDPGELDPNGNETHLKIEGGLPPPGQVGPQVTH